MVAGTGKKLKTAEKEKKMKSFLLTNPLRITSTRAYGSGVVARVLITENSSVCTRVCTYTSSYTCTVIVTGISAHACSYTRTTIVSAIGTMVVSTAVRSSVLHEREDLDEGEKTEADPREGDNNLEDAALETGSAEEARRPFVLWSGEMISEVS